MLRHRICEPITPASTSNDTTSTSTNITITEVTQISQTSQQLEVAEEQTLVGVELQAPDVPPEIPPQDDSLGLMPELLEAEKSLKNAITKAQQSANKSLGFDSLPANFFVPHVDPIPEVVAMRKAHNITDESFAAATNRALKSMPVRNFTLSPLIAKRGANITLLMTDVLQGQANVQYTAESGETFRTPINVEMKTSAIDAGWWSEEFSCCHNWDVNHIVSPPVTWDGGGYDTMSYVLMIDDMDDNAAVVWMMVNMDPRDHKVPKGASGECPWWKLIWPWRYGYCARKRLPGSAMELPNRDFHWRFRGFCPPNHQVHRYRLRVFAQYEWDQRYLKIKYPYNADAIANQLMRVGKNLGFGTIIANGGRKLLCQGPDRQPVEGYLDGIVADYDFARKNFSSVVGTVPPIIDIGTKCADTHMTARFVGSKVRGSWTTVLDVRAGTGLAFNASGVLESGRETVYTLVVDARFMRTSCFVRLLTMNSTDDFGVYLCDNVFVYPNARFGENLHPNRWYHFTISTQPDRLTRVYVNGRLEYEWVVPEDIWLRVFQRQPQYEGMPEPDNLMIFFNDCGFTCRCANGEGEQSQAYVRRVQIYKRVLTDIEVESLYKMQTTNLGGL